MKNVHSRKRNKSHIVITIKADKENRLACRELRKAIRKINCLSEEAFSFEIYF